MAFKMKGFNAGKGTGMSPNTMKKGSAMKMKKGSSMKKPLVGDQHKLPQELKAQIKQAPMTLGMRGNAMQGRNPNMAMKASNAMMPGSMMAMKKQNSAMTLKEGAMSGAAISGVAGRKRTGDPERRLSKGGQKAKKQEAKAMRKGVRSGAGEGAAEAMTKMVASQTPRLAMKSKVRKKGSAMKLKDGGYPMDSKTKVSKEERMKQAKAQGKAMREGRLSDFKRPPIKRTGNTTRLKKENKKYLPEGQRTQVMKKAKAFPLREASPMKLKPGRALKKRKNVYTDYSSDATRRTVGGATIKTVGKEKRGGKTKEFKATTSRSGPRFEKQTKYTKTKNGKTKEISKRKFDQKDYQYGDKRRGIGEAPSKKGDLSKFMTKRDS